jgi:hypothetical protein
VWDSLAVQRFPLSLRSAPTGVTVDPRDLILKGAAKAESP